MCLCTNIRIFLTFSLLIVHVSDSYKSTLLTFIFSSYFVAVIIFFELLHSTGCLRCRYSSVNIFQCIFLSMRPREKNLSTYSISSFVIMIAVPFLFIVVRIFSLFSIYFNAKCFNFRIYFICVSFPLDFSV